MLTTKSKPFIQRVSGRVLLLRTLIGAAALTATSVGASDLNAGETDTVATGGLEEITVTATRREENINRVPISVTAMSQEMIDQKGIKDFQDVVRFTPGISIDNSGTNAISIRGISSSGGAGTTGIYIDDTPIQMRALGFNPDDTLPKTFDLDRVEVLRGPQGTLFGAGSEGGTVRYIMTQPSVTKDSTYARSEVSFTRSGEPSYEAGVAHGGPIIDDVFGYRASIWYRYDGGWIDRIDPTTLQTVDKNSNHANSVAARLAFLVQPVEGLRITPSLMFQNARKHDFSTYWPAYTDVSSGNFKNATPERLPDPDRYYLPAIKLEYEFAHAEFISNSSYYNRLEQTAYQGTAYDLAYFQSIGWPGSGYGFDDAGKRRRSALRSRLDDSDAAMFLVSAARRQRRASAAGVRRLFDSEYGDEHPGDLHPGIPAAIHGRGKPLKWTVGAFWSLSKQKSIEQLKDTRINEFFTALFGEDAFTVFGGDWYHCNGVGSPQTFPDCLIYQNANQSFDRQIAGFGEISYNVTDQLKLTFGGRFAKMTFDLHHYGDGFENFGPDFASGSYRENAFTPKANISYQWDEQNLLYATYAKGFRPGGVNAPLPAGLNPDGSPAGICAPGLIDLGYPDAESPTNYKSDTTQSYEVGSKNGIGDRLRIATSLYYNQVKNIQQSVYVGSCGLQFTDNLGTAVAWGGDIQADLVLGAGFSLEASAGYTSARFSEDSKGGLALKGEAIAGEAAINYAPGTNPPWTVAIGPQYSFKIADRDAFVRMDWEYTSRNPWLSPIQDPNNTAQYNPNAYTLSSTSFASLRAGVSIDKWQLAAFCDNLFDSRTTTNYAEVQVDAFNPNIDQSLPSSVQHNNFTFRPRTIGLTFTYRN